MAIWYSLWPFGNLVATWYIFPRFGTFCLEKTGNPELGRSQICEDFLNPRREQILEGELKKRRHRYKYSPSYVSIGQTHFHNF
jgi:hypothetical protein